MTARLVEQLTAAAKVGARGAVVFGSAHDKELREELRAIARDAGLAIVGAGCMGFWNVRRGLRALGYVEREDLSVGPVSLITHSGSVFSALLRTRLRLGFDLAISSGQELVTTTADYVDHVVDHTETRVLALVLEAVRDGGHLRSSLRRARDAGIEVVLLPVGGSPLGSSLVDCPLRCVGGRVRDLGGADERRGRSPRRRPRRARRHPGRAGVAAAAAARAPAWRPSTTPVRSAALVADLAHDAGVPFADLSDETKATLAARLDNGLEPRNPLDVWGGGADTRALFADCLRAVAADPAVGVTALAIDLVAEYDGDTSYVDAVLDVVAADLDEPLVVLAGLPAALDEPAADRLRAAGVPVLEGFRSGLLALRHLLDAVARPRPDAVDHRPVIVAGPLLAAYGIPTPEQRSASSEADVLAAAEEVGWPVVLKTAAPGITHRSDAQGVVLGVADAEAALAAYRDLARRLGPAVTVHHQVPPGVELSIGLVRDPGLGPLVVVAAGGVLVELLDDRAVALPPLSRDGARRMLDRLRLRPLLDGFRGAPAADIEALVDIIVAVSRIAHEQGDDLDALDLNPVIASADGAVAADVLVVPRVDENEEAPSCTA